MKFSRSTQNIIVAYDFISNCVWRLVLSDVGQCEERITPGFINILHCQVSD